MKRFMPVTELARDERFERITETDRLADPRMGAVNDRAVQQRKSTNRITPDRADASESARRLMHGIFVGEIQALEGAGRTCWDFDVTTKGDTTKGDTTKGGADSVPFALKLDMARQCWDEARHCEISVQLSEWMGSEIGEFAENTVLFEAACSSDAVLRLAGVNRALEGLAIDVFTTMRQFGELAGDPVLEFAEDWMLADEVTHVKMGSDWLRALTADDPERKQQALEFQAIVDKMFSYGGTRSESEQSPIGIARRFRELAGFSEAEIDEIAAVSHAALEEAVARKRAAQQRATAAAVV